MARNIEINIKQQSGETSSYETLYPKTVSKNILYTGEDNVTVWDKLNNMTPSTTFEVGDILLTSKNNIDLTKWQACDGSIIEKPEKDNLNLLRQAQLGELVKNIDLTQIEEYPTTLSTINQIYKIEDIYLIVFLDNSNSVIHHVLLTKNFINFVFYHPGRFFYLKGFYKIDDYYYIWADDSNNFKGFYKLVDNLSIEYCGSISESEELTICEYNNELYGIILNDNEEDDSNYYIYIYLLSSNKEIQNDFISKKKQLVISGTKNKNSGKIIVENNIIYFQWCVYRNSNYNIRWGTYKKGLEYFLGLTSDYILFNFLNEGWETTLLDINGASYPSRYYVSLKQNDKHITPAGFIYTQLEDINNYTRFSPDIAVEASEMDVFKNISINSFWCISSNVSLELYNLTNNIVKNYTLNNLSTLLNIFNYQGEFYYLETVVTSSTNSTIASLNMYKLFLGQITPSIFSSNTQSKYYIKISE